jgi:cytochrome c oxidase cbb3-type subunit 1
MFGAVYYVLPRLAQAELPSPGLVRLHFWCAVLGLMLFVLPLAVGGVLEGRAMNDARIAFMDASKVSLPFLRVSITGDLLMAAGHLLLAVNLCGLLARCAWARWAPVVRSWTARPAAATEVAS